MPIAITIIGSSKVASDINNMTKKEIDARRTGLEKRLGTLIAAAERLKRKTGASTALELEMHIQTLRDFKGKNVPSCKTQWEFQIIEGRVDSFERLLKERSFKNAIPSSEPAFA